MSQDNTLHHNIKKIKKVNRPAPLPRETEADTPLEPASIEKDDKSCAVSNSKKVL